jgi:hypothetical protein
MMNDMFLRWLQCDHKMIVKWLWDDCDEGYVCKMITKWLQDDKW